MQTTESVEIMQEEDFPRYPKYPTGADYDEAQRNPFADCPRCQCDLIDQISSEDRCTVEWYHCAKCGAWYNEAGEIDE